MYTGPYHDFGNILPQFVEPVASDINEEEFSLLTPEKATIAYASGEIPDEFKDFPVDIDDQIDKPLTIRTKTHVEPKQNFH